MPPARSRRGSGSIPMTPRLRRRLAAALGLAACASSCGGQVVVEADVGVGSGAGGQGAGGDGGGATISGGGTGGTSSTTTASSTTTTSSTATTTDTGSGACAPGGPGGSTVLASAQGGPYALVVDGGQVYWTNRLSGTVMKCAASGCGCQPTTLASKQVNVLALAVAGGSAFWTRTSDSLVEPWLDDFTGTVTKCSVGGCGGMPTTLAAKQRSPSYIAADAEHAYWINYAPGTQSMATVNQCSVNGCNGQPSSFTDWQYTDRPSGITVSATTLYWTVANQWVAQCPKASCVGQVTKLTSTKAVHLLAVDASAVYLVGSWPQNGTVYGSVEKVPISGAAAPTTLVTAVFSPNGLAVDGTHVYWTDGLGGTVMKCPIAGCTAPTIVASGLSTPSGIAVDATSVYWTDFFTGSVYKAPK